MFLGDSITEWWDKDVYEKDYSRYENVNLGVAGLTTHGLMNIIKDEDFKKYKPTMIVLMIGVNNVNYGVNKEFISQDIKHIIELLVSIHPKAKILLRGLLPIGKFKMDPPRLIIEEINTTISKYKNDVNIFYIDNGLLFLTHDGTIDNKLMPDNLHLSKEGYEVLSSGLTPVIYDLTVEKNDISTFQTIHSI